MTLLALAALAAFASRQAFLDLRVISVASVIVLTSGAAYLGWKQSPQGTLRWDGQHWFWSDFKANPVCHLRLLMDFQRVVLVSVAASGDAPAYLWLEAMPGDASWTPLRRALVSSQAVVEGGDKENALPEDGDLA